MSADVLGQPLHPGALGDLRPVEILYEFEYPCIFTATAPFGGLLLVYLMEDSDAPRYLVASTSVPTVDALKAGQISVREAMLRGGLWVADQDREGNVQALRAVSPVELPTDALPSDDILLWAA